MATKAKYIRVLQPSSLTVDDAWRAINDSYSAEDVQEIRNAEKAEGGKSKLAFAYSHGNGKDMNALYKYRVTLTAFSKINNTGVWNWTVILGGVKKWNAKNLGHLLSTSKTWGPKAVEMAASNLAQMLQDCRNHKRNMKTGARTPGWLMEIVQNIVVKDASEEVHAGEGTIRVSWSSSDGNVSGGAQSGSPPTKIKRKRSLRLHLSTSSEEPPRAPKKALLAIMDKQTDDDLEDIVDTSSQPFEHDWDEVWNKGKRKQPGGRWEFCTWQEKDHASGFMKCFWRTPSGDEDWTSEMTIMEYESNEPDDVMKKPAAAMKKPAAIMKKPAAEKSSKKQLDPKVRKREHSNAYHKTVAEARAQGHNNEVAKAKGREAARKHIEHLTSKL